MSRFRREDCLIVEYIVGTEIQLRVDTQAQRHVEREREVVRERSVKKSEGGEQRERR